MAYRISFDGVASAEINHVLRAVQHSLNGAGANLLMRVQAQEASASTVASGCLPGQPCSSGEKGGQDIVVVVVVAAVTGAVAGYIAGKLGSSGEKGGQDGEKGGQDGEKGGQDSQKGGKN